MIQEQYKGKESMYTLIPLLYTNMKLYIQT